MERLSLRVVALPEAEICTVPLPLEESGSSCSVYLRCLPGSAAIHLAFLNDEGGIVLRTEIEATGGETVPVQIALGAERDVRVSSRGRKVLTLPPDALYEPPPPIAAAGPGTSLDLAFVIDGTARSFVLEEEGIVSEPLLGRGESWQKQVDLVTRFAEGIAEGVEGNRFTVLAFGDEDLRGIDAPDLKPRYLIHPSEAKRKFVPWSPARCREALTAVEPTPGGDFVDALADALHACSRLPWRERARRLVLIYGDSPGHSVSHPLPQGADARVRRLDVDIEAERLHMAGIEIATLYFDPSEGLGLHQVAFQRELVSATREQYLRLASLPEMAFVLSGFHPEEAARELKAWKGLLGRRAAPGELIGIAES
jgi:hypothetical protein